MPAIASEPTGANSTSLFTQTPAAPVEPAAQSTAPTTEPTTTSAEPVQTSETQVSGEPTGQTDTDAGTDGGDTAGDDSGIAEFVSALAESGIPEGKLTRLLQKYGNDPTELIKAGIEAQDAIGRRDQRGQWLEQLEQAGYGPKVIEQLVQEHYRRAAGQGDNGQKPQTSAVRPLTMSEINQYIGFNEKGEAFKKPGAPPDIEQRWAVSQEQANRFRLDPRGALMEILQEVLPTITEQTQRQTAEELQRHRLEQTQSAQHQSWLDANAKLLYVDPADPSKGISSLATEIDKIFNEVEDGVPVINPSLSIAKRLERAKQIALDRSKPTLKTPKVNPNSRRTPNAAAGAGAKFDEDAWCAAHPGFGLWDLVQAKRAAGLPG